MAKVTYEKEITALLVIDPYNDFVSEGGKIWDRLKSVAEANKCVPNMLQVLNAGRNAGLHVFYALHHRYRPGDYKGKPIRVRYLWTNLSSAPHWEQAFSEDQGKTWETNWTMNFTRTQ
jgi:nicotinamidase-related amidase